MPFYALPFGTDITSLAQTYHAQGIPHLVVLNGNVTITEDGVGEVAMDPTGADFPWRPQPLSELLPNEYIHGASRTLQPVSDLKEKYLMLYFSVSNRVVL